MSWRISSFNRPLDLRHDECGLVVLCVVDGFEMLDAFRLEMGVYVGVVRHEIISVGLYPTRSSGAFLSASTKDLVFPTVGQFH